MVTVIEKTTWQAQSTFKVLIFMASVVITVNWVSRDATNATS
jgi:hypothetical protein